MGYKTMVSPYAVRSSSPRSKSISTMLFAFLLSVEDEILPLLPHMMQQSRVRVLALNYVPFMYGSWPWV
jgi:hypothetical protein